MQGTLSLGVLPGILRDLYVGRKTGMLYFVRGEERRGLRFRNGNIIRGHTNVAQEHLGETLVRLGRLSQTDLDRATQVVVQQRIRLGAVLAELEIMTRDQVQEAIALHAREILLSVFNWSDGSYTFEDQDPNLPVDEDITNTISTGEMILEAVRRVDDPDLVRFGLGNPDRILGLSSDPLLRFQKIGFTPADGYILSRIDGTLSAREVVQMIPMVPEETERSLFGLLCTGVIEYLPLPPKTVTKPVPLRAKPTPQPTVASPAATANRAAPPPPSPAAAASAARPDPRPPVRAEAPSIPRPTTPPSTPPPMTSPGRSAVPAAPTPAATPTPTPGDGSTARREEIIKIHEEMKGQNHFEVLGISKTSTEAQVKEAYFRMAKRFHPDAHRDSTFGDLKDKLEAIFIRLGEAYEVLRNPRTRSSYETDLAARAPRGPAATPSAPSPEPEPAVDPQADARMAEESVRRADKRFAEEKYWDAIQLLEPAIPKLQGRPRHRARILLARCYMKNPHWVKRAEEMLQSVVQEDPKQAEAYFTLGNIYKGGGLKSRAIGMFRKTVEIKPEHEDALRELQELTPAQESNPADATEESGSGIFKKLFGRS